MEHRSLLATLAPRERDILAVLALQKEPAARTPWLASAGDAGVRDDAGRKLSGPAFEDVAARLVALRIVEAAPRPRHYRLARGWVFDVLDDARERGALAALVAGALEASTSRHYGRAAGPALLAALALRDSGEAQRLEPSYFGQVPWQAVQYVDVLGLDVPGEWLAVLSSRAQTAYAQEAAAHAFAFMLRIGPAPLALALASAAPETRARAGLLAAFSGDVARAREALVSTKRSAWLLGAAAVVSLVEGRLDAARAGFVEAGTGARGQRVELPGELAIFDLLLAITSDDATIAADAPRRLVAAARARRSYPYAFDALSQLLAFRRSGEEAEWLARPTRPLEVLVTALARRWTGETEPAPRAFLAAGVLARAEGYGWIADEIERAVSGEPAGGLLALSGQREGWEHAVESLLRAATSDASHASADHSIWWTIHIGPTQRMITVDAHRVGARGGKGTSVPTSRLWKERDFLDEADRRVVDAFERAHAYSSQVMSIEAVVPLIGHPRVRDELGRKLSVERGEQHLEVTRTADGGARVVLVPSIKGPDGVMIVREADRLVVYQGTAASRRIHSALPMGAMTVPAHGLAKLHEALAAVGAGGEVRVVSDGLRAEASRPADGQLRVLLARTATSLRARVCVLAAGEEGPAFRPGAPPGELVVDDGGTLVRLVRDLEAERARLDALLERCPVLASLEQDGVDRIARDLPTFLELLIELREAGSDVVVAWREGTPLRAPTLRTAAHVKVSVKDAGAWLAVEGTLAVDEDRVVTMTELLAARSRAEGRFVPIGDDQYIALTDDLRRKLDGISRAQALSSDGKVPGALLSVDELWEGMHVSFSKTLEKRRAALESAGTLAVPVPRSLAAELRDYQQDGLVFLARRAAAGLGACLADDMGLGKTVQAIALLLHRRKAGPALVVVPTSVRRNWETELARFAPSLDVRRFGEGDREACVTTAASGDVIMATYGLLVAEEKLLASRTWGTVIFDEAHALKNASTQRWRAARTLSAGATIALTGTPLENHAGELHALFDLLVPGMLGTRTMFDRALGNAIANGDRDAAALLRRIVRPFVLRRTREEVLSELPPRTEITQVVTPAAEQHAYYEAIRRTALASLASAQKTKGARAGQARLQLLAEITRLRRAAIDPRLVGGAEAPAGTKLDALVELLSELKAERRRALVFSQYLEVLDLAGDRLHAAGLSCLRLDGSMSEAGRAAAVASFQDGSDDVFLVSLKAGGVGMNLTAADTVVFLDPWWNPAVEDQATARAHRMGQSRPVTVVRLVTEGTIEEKVLALHAKKRKLYEDIVSEADGEGTLSIEAIGALLGD